MKLSEHSKQRMKQRTDYNHKQRVRLFADAIMYGKSPNDFKDNKELRDFLLSRKNCKVKLYKNYVFIYSKNSHRLYTMYKLPEKYIKE
jgi:hypothetical protein